MAWYPKAQKLPILRNYTKRKRSRTRGIVLHVDGGNAESLYSFFNTPGRNASSHFYVKANGFVEQYIDTDFIAYTSGDANNSTIGIETQGKGVGSWTTKQRKAIVELLAWLSTEHSVPVVPMHNSKTNSVGIATHRVGVNGNFPLTGVQRGRLQRGGGELWSSSRGKICPGYDRQKQWPGIVKAVERELLETKYQPGYYHTVKPTNGYSTTLGYAKPSTQSKIKTRRKKNHNLYIVRFVVSGKTVWGVTKYGTYYKMSKLAPGKASK